MGTGYAVVFSPPLFPPLRVERSPSSIDSVDVTAYADEKVRLHAEAQLLEGSQVAESFMGDQETKDEEGRRVDAVGGEVEGEVEAEGGRTLKMKRKRRKESSVPSWTLINLFLVSEVF